MSLIQRTNGHRLRTANGKLATDCGNFDCKEIAAISVTFGGIEYCNPCLHACCGLELPWINGTYVATYSGSCLWGATHSEVLSTTPSCVGTGILQVLYSPVTGIFTVSWRYPNANNADRYFLGSGAGPTIANSLVCASGNFGNGSAEVTLL